MVMLWLEILLLVVLMLQLLIEMLVKLGVACTAWAGLPSLLPRATPLRYSTGLGYLVGLIG